MDKSRGGSSRLISTLMQQTGGENGDVFLDKSSKKDKLRRLSCMDGEMDQLSHPLPTNSAATKRVKFPKKFSHHCGAINHISAPPRKLRSAMKKRESEVGELSKDCTKKHKAIEVSNRSEAQKPSLGFREEFKDSKMSSVMTKDEEEVAEALFALAQTAFNVTPQIEVKPPLPTAPNTTLQVEVKPHPSSLLVEETMRPPNGKKSRNRCSVHVYICSFIKLLQTKTHKVSNQEILDTNPQTITNDDYNIPKTTTENMASQDLTNPAFNSQQQVVPYFDTMDHHHHAHPSTQNLTSTGCCYRNWESQRHNRMGPVSGSKYPQGSLLQALGSNTEQQRRCIPMSLLASNKGKMKLSDCSSGYDEKRGLFFVDGPTLKLTL